MLSLGVLAFAPAADAVIGHERLPFRAEKRFGDMRGSSYSHARIRIKPVALTSLLYRGDLLQTISYRKG